jgi:hypothetical protein
MRFNRKVFKKYSFRIYRGLIGCLIFLPLVKEAHVRNTSMGYLDQELNEDI